MSHAVLTMKALEVRRRAIEDAIRAPGAPWLYAGVRMHLVFNPACNVPTRRPPRAGVYEVITRAGVQLFARWTGVAWFMDESLGKWRLMDEHVILWRMPRVEWKADR